MVLLSVVSVSHSHLQYENIIWNIIEIIHIGLKYFLLAYHYTTVSFIIVVTNLLLCQIYKLNLLIDMYAQSTFHTCMFCIHRFSQSWIESI